VGQRTGARRVLWSHGSSLAKLVPPRTRREMLNSGRLIAGNMSARVAGYPGDLSLSKVSRFGAANLTFAVRRPKRC